MRYAPSLPPLAEVPDAVEIKGLRPARAVRPVRPRLFPAQVAEHYPRREAIAGQAAPAEEERRSGKARRQFRRRITPAEPLLETRSSFERRRKSRRQGDTATAVDEEV